jgi:hypothetical protein
MKARWVIHPVLIGLYPIVSLYAHNIHQTAPRELVAPIGLVLVLTFLTWSALTWILKDAHRSGLIVSLFLFIFFSMSHGLAVVDDAFTWLSAVWVRKEVHVSPLTFLAWEGAFSLVLLVIILKREGFSRRFSRFLDVFSLLLVCFSLTIILREVAQSRAGAHPATGNADVTRVIETGTPRPGPLRDVYYIVLDGYARSDVMKTRFGLDNGPFLEKLERLGFYVARNSRANYCQTPLCMASALNCEYLEGLGDGHDSIEEDLRNRVGRSKVSEALKRLGYRFVTFATGFDVTDHPEADVYLSPQARLTGFQWMLLSSTPLVTTYHGPSPLNPYRLARERTLYVLETLPRVAKLPAPTFTFAHIVCPHPPFLFGEHGEDVSPYGTQYRLTDGDQYRLFYGDLETYIRGYRQQAAFLTEKVQAMIEQILALSERPPIIIIQSDHGSGLGLDISHLDRTDLEERMSILNAYYLPDGGESALYDCISPVNSFRIVSNYYFGAHLDLLEDRTFYSTWEDPSDFIDVTDRLKSSAGGASP